MTPLFYLLFATVVYTTTCIRSVNYVPVDAYQLDIKGIDINETRIRYPGHPGEKLCLIMYTYTYSHQGVVYYGQDGYKSSFDGCNGFSNIPGYKTCVYINPAKPRVSYMFTDPPPALTIIDTWIVGFIAILPFMLCLYQKH